MTVAWQQHGLLLPEFPVFCQQTDHRSGHSQKKDRKNGYERGPLFTCQILSEWLHSEWRICMEFARCMFNNRLSIHDIQEQDR